MHGALKLDIQAPAQTKGAQAIFKELELNLGAVVAAVPADVCGGEVTCHAATAGRSEFSTTATGIGCRRSTKNVGGGHMSRSHWGPKRIFKYSNGNWVSSQQMWGEGEVTSRGRVLCSQSFINRN